MGDFIVYEDLATPKCGCEKIATKKIIGAEDFQHSHPTIFLCEDCFKKHTEGKKTRRSAGDYFERVGLKGLKSDPSDASLEPSRMQLERDKKYARRKIQNARRAEKRAAQQEEREDLRELNEISINIIQALGSEVEIPDNFVQAVKVGGYFYQVYKVEGKRIGFYNGEPRIELSEDCTKIIKYL